jgi:hypothetical protein
MGYRGRLIFPMTSRIEIIDTVSTASNGGVLGGGYDQDFREPVVFAGGGVSTSYFAAVDLPCQVETEESADAFAKLSMSGLGDESVTEIQLAFHFRDLEDAGLVDATGRAQIHNGSRLIRVVDRSGIEVDNYSERDLVVTESVPRSYGLTSGNRNLLLVDFTRRGRSVRAT